MISPPSGPPFLNRRALWIFLAAFALRLLILVRFSHSVHFLPGSDDMKFYNDWALQILQGRWTDHQAFYGLPGYAYLLASIYKIAGGFDPFTVALLQSAADAEVACLVYLISRRIFAPTAEETTSSRAKLRPEVIGASAAVAWVLFMPAQVFSIILMPTVWLLLIFHFYLWMVVRTQRSSWWNPWLWLGLGAGLTATVVATILFLVPLMLVAIGLSVDAGRPVRRRLPKILLAAVTLCAATFAGASPAWIHNYFIAHEPVMLSAHSGINFWIGNNPTATGYPKMPPGIRATQDGLLKDSITLAERAAGHHLSRAEVSRYWSARANAYISSHRLAWMRLMGVKIANFWNAYRYDDLSIIKLLRDDGIVPPGLNFGIIAALGLAGTIPVCWRFPAARWVAAAVLLHMAAVLSVFITERYRLAAVPGLMILGAGGLWQLWSSFADGQWRAATVYLCLAGSAAWFVSMPRGDAGIWSLDYYKAGIRATDVGDLEKAQRNLETAYAYVQDNTDINFALGNLWLAKANRASSPGEKASFGAHAKLFYRRALDLNPTHAGTLNNLGVLAWEEKRYDLAERFLAASVESEPEAAKTFYLLARVRFDAGKLPEARQALDEALRRRPEQKDFLEFDATLKAAFPHPAAESPLNP